MVKLSKLVEGYQNFYKQYFIDNPELYKTLVENGQSPKILVIACSDSRVDPSIIMGTEPGDIFVVRNVANLVPPYEDGNNGCHGVSAAIEYAVTALGVENIIVMGHSHCGGIAALVDADNSDHPFIEQWINIAKPARDNAKKICSCGCSDLYEVCEKEAIKVSLHNLLTFPFVRDAISNTSLELHGWYFCLETGKIEIIHL